MASNLVYVELSVQKIERDGHFIRENLIKERNGVGIYTQWAKRECWHVFGAIYNLLNSGTIL